MKIIIDRFEGDFAVVETEDKKMINLPRQFIPVGAEEGVVLTIDIDTKETIARHDKISTLMKDVWRD